MLKINKTFMNKFKSGFIAIIGPPNAGKSTLLNKLLKKKISITSKKPQTTRNRIIGILTEDSTQFVFIDTPGVNRTLNLFNTKMINLAKSSIIDADIILLIIDITNQNMFKDQRLIKQINFKKKVILVLNKIDKINRNNILNKIKLWSDKYSFDEIIPISAKKGSQIKTLIHIMKNFIPFSPPIYPPGSLTDMSEEFFISEIIREKIFRLTGQEIPHSVAVTIDMFENKKDTSILTIYATIYVEHNSQKGILIGKDGKKINNISVKSRLEIEKKFEKKVFLKLFIKVEKKWTKNTKVLKLFGY